MRVLRFVRHVFILFMANLRCPSFLATARLYVYHCIILIVYIIYIYIYLLVKRGPQPDPLRGHNFGGYPDPASGKPLEQSSADGLLERQHLEVDCCHTWKTARFKWLV